jgi:hypothetical protein
MEQNCLLSRKRGADERGYLLLTFILGTFNVISDVHDSMFHTVMQMEGVRCQVGRELG